MEQKERLFVKIFAKKCVGCEKCVTACLQQALGMSYYDDYEYAAVEYFDRCNGCLKCLKACEHNAIEITNMKIWN